MKNKPLQIVITVPEASKDDEELQVMHCLVEVIRSFNLNIKEEKRVVTWLRDRCYDHASPS